MGSESDTATREAGTWGDEGTLRGWEGEERTLSCGGDRSCVGLDAADVVTGVERDEAGAEVGSAVMRCRPLGAVLWMFSIGC